MHRSFAPLCCRCLLYNVAAVSVALLFGACVFIDVTANCCWPKGRAQGAALGCCMLHAHKQAQTVAPTLCPSTQVSRSAVPAV